MNLSFCQSIPGFLHLTRSESSHVTACFVYGLSLFLLFKQIRVPATRRYPLQRLRFGRSSYFAEPAYQSSTKERILCFWKTEMPFAKCKYWLMQGNRCNVVAVQLNEMNFVLWNGYKMHLVQAMANVRRNGTGRATKVDRS